MDPFGQVRVHSSSSSLGGHRDQHQQWGARHEGLGARYDAAL
jgi:hypothetical protein